MKKNLFVMAAMFIFMACETGNGGKNEKDENQDAFDATPIYTIEAPVCKANGTPDSTLNVAEVNAWVNERKLPVSGTIKDGILHIGLPAIPASYLQGLSSGYTSYPGIQSELTPANVKWGVLKLSYADDMGIEHVAMPGTDKHTTINLNYADRDATLTESAKKLPVKVGEMTMFVTLDVNLKLKKGWNVIVEEQSLDMDSLSASVKAETTDKFPEAGTWYFF
jgi:hypothetical protein